MATKNHPTKIALPSNTKATVIAVLNENLAPAIDLALASKQAHWNLKGPQFIAVHEMIDRFRSGLDEHVDTLAERAVQLGGTALGSLQAVSAGSKLKPYPTDIYTASWCRLIQPSRSITCHSANSLAPSGIVPL